MLDRFWRTGPHFLIVALVTRVKHCFSPDRRNGNQASLKFYTELLCISCEDSHGPHEILDRRFDSLSITYV
jgi:hypothetical protein